MEGTLVALSGGIRSLSWVESDRSSGYHLIASLIRYHLIASLIRYGLLTVDGVAKPAYRAFELLYNAGMRRLRNLEVTDTTPQYMNESTVSAFATLGDRFGTGTGLQLFLANFGPEVGASPSAWVPGARNVTITMHRDASDGPWPSSGLLRRIDDDSTAPYAAWVQMGKPPSLNPSQLAQLHAKSQTKDEWVALAVQGEVATLTLELPEYGVAHLAVQLSPSTKQRVSLDGYSRAVG
jgi:xylan 1,4-beta-xylosidase